MDSHSILDHGGAAPESNAPASQADVRFPGEDGGRSLAEMAERDLSATLQLLAERAQYITGATGAAIALRDHEEMVCRASAGPSAPEVGTQLQINSGLSGESVRTRQTLRCDDASTDRRVNRESCEALGISSVVVMPLLRGDEVIGVFELFSNQANIFETRDIAALERMGAMVHAALEHSATSLGLDPLPADQTTHPSLPPSGNGHHGEATEPSFAPTLYESMQAFSQDDDLVMESAAAPCQEPSTAASLASSGIAFHIRMPAQTPPPREETPAPPASPSIEVSPQAAAEETDILEVQPEIVAEPSAEQADNILDEEPPPSPISRPATDDPSSLEVASTQSTMAERAPTTAPEIPSARGALASLQKCEACGFPVSEGRRLCLDCEKKASAQPPKPAPLADLDPAPLALASSDDDDAPGHMPNFFAGGEPQESWIATHKLVILAILIGVIAVVAAAMLR